MVLSMANDSAQQKTEDPTPRRLQQAREKGQVPRSKELTMFLLQLIGFGGLAIIMPYVVSEIIQLAKYCFSFGGNEKITNDFLIKTVFESLQQLMIILSPFFLVLFIAAIISPILLGGLILTMEPIGFKFERLDPIKGIQKILSWQGVVELIKSMIKFILLAVVVISLMWASKSQLMTLGFMSIEEGISSGLSIMLWVLLATAGSLILVVLVDVPFQLWSFKNQLKMSLQEIKDELKETEGTPEVRSRVRSMQREIAKRRMMTEIPNADVVITNPTHFAVAIQYKQSESAAPTVVAKGMGVVAGRIKSIAEENNVTLVSLPPLARALYFSTEIGDEVPSGLYVAIAKVLAYVYQLKRFKAGQAHRPHISEKDIEIPEALQR